MGRAHGAAPVLTGGAPVNGPTTGGPTLTISGTNFGPTDTDTSPTAWIGATLCNTTNWMSTTAIVCQLPAGAGKPTMITVGVASLTGSLRSWFTYDCELAAASFVTSVVRVAVRSGLEV